MDENQYKEGLKANGVDLPDLESKPEEKPAEEPKKEDVQPPKEEEPKEDLETKPHKRSIYEEYKEKKVELKTERELREQAERERDEYRQKLEAFNNAKSPEEQQDAKDELEKFAEEINADPKAIKRMRELFLKDLKTQADVPEDVKKDLEEFKAWKQQNSQVIEQQMFEKEFKSVLPTLREMFPTLSDEESEVVKKKVDELAHSKEWHDKSLDYVVFKNKQILEKFVSPRKAGMESKTRKEVESDSYEFDPNADYSSMTPKQREQWEENYRKSTQNTGLATDSQGRKIII